MNSNTKNVLETLIFVSGIIAFKVLRKKGLV